MVDNGELTDEQAKIELNKLVERKNKDKENMDSATVKEAKNVPNELIKCNAIESIEDSAITLEHEAPKELKGHNHLPICQEETQNLEYLAYGEEGEIDSEIEEESNYDLEILFEKEDETEEEWNHDFEKEDECNYDFVKEDEIEASLLES